MKILWIIQTRKWKVRIKGEPRDEDVSDTIETRSPDWERIEVVIEDEPVQPVITDKEN